VCLLHNFGEAFIGIDVVKHRNAAAVARPAGTGRSGNSPSSTPLRRVCDGCWRGWRQNTIGSTSVTRRAQPAMAFISPWVINAPSWRRRWILKKTGDRVKTHRRDAVAIARLLRAGELIAVWAPTRGTKPCAISSGLARQRWKTCGASGSRSPPLMLRQGRIYPGKTTWGARHAGCSASLTSSPRVCSSS
jgi:transposase